MSGIQNRLGGETYKVENNHLTASVAAAYLATSGNGIISLK
jgi:hypothetical protein